MVDSISTNYQNPYALQSSTTTAGTYPMQSTYNNSIFQSGLGNYNLTGNYGLMGLGNTGLNGLGVGFDFDNDIMARTIDWNNLNFTSSQQTTTQQTSATPTEQTTTTDEVQEEETSEGGSNIGKIGLAATGLTIPTIIKAIDAHKAKAPLKLLTKQHGIASICMGIVGLAAGWITDKIIDACKKKSSSTVAIQN